MYLSCCILLLGKLNGMTCSLCLVWKLVNWCLQETTRKTISMNNNKRCKDINYAWVSTAQICFYFFKTFFSLWGIGEYFQPKKITQTSRVLCHIYVSCQLLAVFTFKLSNLRKLVKVFEKMGRNMTDSHWDHNLPDESTSKTFSSFNLISAFFVSGLHLKFKFKIPVLYCRDCWLCWMRWVGWPTCNGFLIALLSLELSWNYCNYFNYCIK